MDTLSQNKNSVSNPNIRKICIDYDDCETLCSSNCGSPLLSRHKNKNDRRAETLTQNTTIEGEKKIKRKKSFFKLFKWFGKQEEKSNSETQLQNTDIKSNNTKTNPILTNSNSVDLANDSASDIFWKSLSNKTNLCDSDKNVEIKTEEEILEPSNPFYIDRRDSSFSTTSSDIQRLSSNNSSKSGRVKRRAPLPPSSNSNSSKQLNSSNRTTCSASPIPNVEISPRPFNRNRFSNSESHVSTLKSSTLSNTLSSNISLGSHASMTASSSDVSSRPWYRRKSKSKSKKKSSKSNTVEQFYEYWRPEIQVNEGIISVKKETPTAVTEHSGTLVRNKINKIFGMPKRLSKVSLLASISQIDSEAVAEIEKKKNRENGQTGSTIDMTNSYILTQTDLTGDKLLDTTLSSSQTLSNVCDDIKLSNQESYIYDFPKPSVLQQKHSIDPSLRKNEPTSVGEPRNKISSISPVKKDVEVKTSLNNISMANMDAEMFYRLAKDIQGCSNPNSPTNVSTSQTKNVRHDLKDNSNRVTSKTAKTFGLRMNQLFAPDVSVIMETAESMTSSVTTPADDQWNSSNLKKYLENKIGKGEHDFPNNILTENEFNYEYSFKAEDARELMKDIIDVKQVVKRINEEEELLAQERIDQENDQEVSTPLPIAIPTEENKPREEWPCPVCTLINLPWKIMCEACSSRRPDPFAPNVINECPTVDDRQNELVGLKIISKKKKNQCPIVEDRQNELEALKIKNVSGYLRKEKASIPNSPDTVRAIDSVSQAGNPKTNSWELELRKYFCQGKNLENRPDAFPSSIVNDRDHEDKNLEKHQKTNDKEFANRLELFESLVKHSSNTNVHSEQHNRRKQRKFMKKMDAFHDQVREQNSRVHQPAYRKKPVLNSFGAVKNVVSLMNNIKDDDKFKKDIPVRRKSNCNKINNFIKDQTNFFEKNNENQGIERKKHERLKIEGLPRDIDVLSAITKFDELAALAEVERLNPVNNFRSRSKKFVRLEKKEVVPLQYSSVEEYDSDKTKVASTIKNECGTPIVMMNNVTPKQRPNSIEVKSEIRDGVLYTNNDGRIGTTPMETSEFELIQVNEFEEIEGEQKEEEEQEMIVDFLSEYEDIDNEDDSSDESSEIESSPSPDDSNFDNDLLDPNNLSTEKLRQYSNFQNEDSSQDVDLSQLSMSDRRRISTIFTLLETAISKGDHYEAADLAKELAGLKVPCSANKNEPTTPDKALRRHSSVNSDDNYSVYRPDKNSAYRHNNDDDYEIVEFQHESPVISRQKSIDYSKRRQIKSEIFPNDLYSTSNAHRTIFNVQLFVEDRTSHQGPINVSVDSQMTVGQLRTKVHENFGFPPEVQRWILGRRLADNDEETLSFYHITTEGCPIFLYLVAPNQGKVFSIDKPLLKSNSETFSITSNPYQGKVFNMDKPVLKSNSETFSNTSNDIRKIRSIGKHEHFMNSNRSLRFDPEEMNDLESNVESSDDEETKDTLFNTRSNIINDHMKTDTYSGIKLANGTSRLKNIKEEPKSTNTNDSKSVRPPILPKRVDSNASLDISIHRCSKFIDAVKQKDIKKQNSIEIIGESNPIAQVNQNHRTFKDAFQNPSGNSVKVKNKQEHNPIDSIDEKTPIAQAVQYNHGYNSKDNIKERKPIAKTNQNNGSFEDALQNLAKQIPQANQNYTDKGTSQNPAKSIGQANQKSTGSASQNPAKSIAQASQNKPTSNGASQNPEKPITQASQENGSFKDVSQNPARSNAQVSQNKPTGNIASQTQAKSIAQANQNSTGNGASQTPAAESNGATWQCPQCTLMNPAARPGCEACSAAKPQLDKQVLPLESLDKMDLVLCTDEFECSVCYNTVGIGEGIVLRECLHTFCRECLRDTARYSDNAAVTCPYRDDQYSCKANLQDREVKALVNAKDFDAHLNKSVKQAAGAMENVFHCKTPDCKGFCVFEDNVNVFLCNVCFKQNCLTCQAQHTEVSCKQYQDMLASQEDLDSLKTKKFFEDMIARGDGMPCPACSVMLVRKWGCDWMKCPMCKTEICWVTRKPRWGPRGPGDTTGGCQCGLYGRKCHPKCTFCH